MHLILQHVRLRRDVELDSRLHRSSPNYRSDLFAPLLKLEPERSRWKQRLWLSVGRDLGWKCHSWEVGKTGIVQNWCRDLQKRCDSEFPWSDLGGCFLHHLSLLTSCSITYGWVLLLPLASANTCSKHKYHTPAPLHTSVPHTHTANDPWLQDCSSWMSPGWFCEFFLRRLTSKTTCQGAKPPQTLKFTRTNVRF